MRRRPSPRTIARRVARYRFDVLESLHHSIRLARTIAIQADDDDLEAVLNRLDHLAYHEATKFLGIPKRRP